MTHRHHDAREWQAMRHEAVIAGTLDGMDRLDIHTLARLADMARESKRLPPAARRVVMSAALEFATDEEATAVYPPLPNTTTTTTTETPTAAADPDDALLRDLCADLGIELAWALDGLNADAKGIPVVSVAWSRIPAILDHHLDDAFPVVTIDWIRGYLSVEVTVYAWRRWNRGESWPTGQPTRYRDVPGVGTVEEIRYQLATIRARSPGRWAGSLSFDGGLQISEPRGGV